MFSRNKKVIFVIVALLVGMLALAACRNNDDPAPTPTPANQGGTTPGGITPGTTTPDPGTTTQDPVEPNALFPDNLRIWGTNIAAGGIGADSNMEVWAWQEISRLTGTEIEWTHPVYGDGEAFTLMIATRDWPDIIQTNWHNVPGGPASYHLDRVIIRLNELIETQMPHFEAALNATGFRHALYVGEDRDILFLSGIQEPVSLSVIGPQIRMEWLDEVGLPIPSTVDELDNVLRAFRDQNVGGRDDIIAQTGFGVRALGAGATNFGLEMHMWPFGTNMYFYHVDGEVTFGPLTPEFEAAVTRLAGLLEEGLLDPEWATQGRTDSDGKVMDDQSGFMYGIQNTMIHNTRAANRPDEPFTMLGIPHLSATPGGGRYVLHNRFVETLSFGHSTAAITTSAENPEAVARWMDFWWTPEATMIHNFGIEGLTYTYDAAGNPIYTEYMLDHIREGTWANYTVHISTAWPTFRRFDSFSPTLHPVAAEGMLNWGASQDVSRVLPQLNLGDADADRIPTIMMDINTYVEETVVMLVNGVRPLSYFPTFRQNLQGMNIDEAIAAYQRAFDLIR